MLACPRPLPTRGELFSIAAALLRSDRSWRSRARTAASDFGAAWMNSSEPYPAWISLTRNTSASIFTPMSRHKLPSHVPTSTASAVPNAP